MNKSYRFLAAFVALAAAVVCASAASAASGSIDRDAAAALQSLYERTPAARALGDKAAGILVFPNVVKAGFIIGGQGGDGIMLKKGKTVGYYNTGGLSVGLQAGAQSFGYVLFFMSDAALKY